jgi:hypothetical protein
LANEHNQSWRFEHFAPALGKDNYDKRVSYRVEILESSIRTGLRVYEAAADGEYGDNIVAMSSIREDIPKSASVDDVVHFKYKTTAYMPPWNAADSAPSEAKCGAASRICRIKAHDDQVKVVANDDAVTKSCATSKGKVIGQRGSLSCVCSDNTVVNPGQVCSAGTAPRIDSSSVTVPHTQGSTPTAPAIPSNGTTTTDPDTAPAIPQNNTSTPAPAQNDGCTAQGGRVESDGVCRCSNGTAVFKLHGAHCP